YLRGRRGAGGGDGGAGGGSPRCQRRRSRRPACRLERVRPSARHGDAGLWSADRRSDRARRFRRQPRTLGAVLEVSNVDVGDQLISRLQMLGEDFETEVEGWQVDRVRAELKTDRYFH